MEIKASLTPSQAAKAAKKNPTVPTDGYIYVGQKEEFDYGFEDFIKWMTGATVEVVDGDPSYAQKLMIEHAKFGLAERIRSMLAQATYDENGKLTDEWRQKIDEFVASYVPSPGRSSALAKKSPEQLAKEAEKARKRLAEIEAILARANA